MTATALLHGVHTMRPGTPADHDDVVSLVRARASYMRAHSQGRWASWHKTAETLGEQVGDPAWPTWVLVNQNGRAMGITTATFETPSLGWTEEEQTQPALFLQSTVTHPDAAGEGLGILIAFWALHYAAAQGQEWVRRGVITLGQDNRGLVAYYRFQGWRVTRSVSHPRRPGATVWSLQRPAETQPALDELLVPQAH